MMLDWNAYQAQILATVRELNTFSPDTVRGYRMLSDAGAKTARLDAKTRELISLAVAVSLRCDGCIVVHTDAALRHGATREEIAEALGVAVSVNAGAALVFSTRVLDAVKAKQGPEETLNA
jgi:AhpD family alkylhydroperoxidase